MHYQLEIIMPPTDDIKGVIEEILAPFDENCEESDDKNGHPFWDWWQLGGRWSGNKMLDKLGREQFDGFYAALEAAHITVTRMQWGKQTLEPASQIDAVNRLWHEYFPHATIDCPLFDNTKETEGDVMTLRDTPAHATCCHVIIAGPGYRAGTVEACTMLKTEIWNGVVHQKTEWDGTIGAALAFHTKRLTNYAEEYREAHTPQPDWIVVTVDYHS